MKNEALTVCLLVGSLGSALGGLVPDVTGDTDLIRSSPHQAYYRVSVDSKKWWIWGLAAHRWEEPSPQNRGYGWDAVAIPFDGRGKGRVRSRLYLHNHPGSIEEARLRRLYEGITTKADVLSLYGSVREVRHVAGYEVWYCQIRVWNPAEELPSGGPSN
jgi:hypothetical protein